MTKIFVTAADPLLVEQLQATVPDCEIAVLPPAGRSVDAPDAYYFIDWLLEDMSGLEICRRLRSDPETAGCHITMVLDGVDPVAQRRALSAGADDYMQGPLTAKRLKERLERHVGLGSAPRSEQSRGGLTLYLDSHQVRWQGKMIPLSPRELKLLSAFVANPDRLLTRQQLVALSGKLGSVNDDRTVDVWVGRLRRTLETHGAPRFLRTVRSMGYVFDSPDRHSPA